jgi:hypothetical protein
VGSVNGQVVLKSIDGVLSLLICLGTLHNTMAQDCLSHLHLPIQFLVKGFSTHTQHPCLVSSCWIWGSYSCPQPTSRAHKPHCFLYMPAALKHAYTHARPAPLLCPRSIAAEAQTCPTSCLLPAFAALMMT